MAINMNTTTLTEGPEGADEFITNVFIKSGILRLLGSNVKRISTKGQSFPIIPRTNVQEAGETELKAQTDAPITSLVAKPITLATTVPVSKQLINSHEGILAEVSKQGASDVGDALDAKVTGEVAVVGDSFGQLKNIPTSVVLETKANFYTALATLSAQGSTPTGLFLSKGYWAELAGSVNPLGQSLFNIVGDINGGTFEGIPYATFSGMTKEAYLGDFEGKAKAGSVYDIEVDINEKAVLGEGANSINLWQRNMIGVRVEGEFAFNYVPAGFVKLVPPAEVPAG